MPRTAILGAVILTGLLGGSMATQIRIWNPLYSHILFSVYLGLFMWGGLWLRNSEAARAVPDRRKIALRRYSRPMQLA